ncbi:MAG: putative phosphodiesterase [Bradymonadia bacterium]|jgi:predicted phosphodiesterase
MTTPNSHTRVAFLGDIHGNALALDAALSAIEHANIDRVVCLGDLLTYGCAPRDCVSLATEMMQRFDTTFIAGNHEPFYIEGQAGDERRYATKRAFIAESVRWTLQQIEDVDYANAFPWQTELHLGRVYVHHAHPYRDGTWAYVNTQDDEARSGATLATSQWNVGIFGHTHRARLTSFDASRPVGSQVRRHVGHVHLDDTLTWVLNTGSAGQPRGMAPTWLELNLTENTATHHEIEYDVDAHIAQIRAAGLSDEATAQLIRFFDSY